MKQCARARVGSGKVAIKVIFNSASCFACVYKCVFVNVNTAAQTADPTVPGRSPCRPSGIQHRSCHTGCPPALLGLSGTSPDMNSGK